MRWVVHGEAKTESCPSLPQPGAGLGTNASLAQMVSGLVGQLLMQPVLVGESSFLPSGNVMAKGRNFHSSEVHAPSLVSLAPSQFSPRSSVLGVPPGKTRMELLGCPVI